MSERANFIQTPLDFPLTFQGDDDELTVALQSGSASYCCGCNGLFVRPCVTRVIEEGLTHLFCPDCTEGRSTCMQDGECQPGVRLFTHRICMRCKAEIPACAGFAVERHLRGILNGELSWIDIRAYELCTACGEEHMRRKSDVTLTAHPEPVAA